MSERHLVYLAGPIEHANSEQRLAWREAAAILLEEDGFGVINPLGKDGWPDEEIVQADLRHLERCDIVLAWLPAHVRSSFTHMEVFYAAHVLRRPVVVWGLARQDAGPALRYFSTVIVEAFDEAILAVKSCRAFWCDRPTAGDKSEPDGNFCSVLE